MGDAADDLMDWEFKTFGYDDDWDVFQPRRKSFQAGTGDYNWKIKGGEVISMWDMEERHLLNSIQICKDHGNTGKQNQLEEVYNTKYNKDPNKQMTHIDFLKRTGDLD